MCRTTPAPLQLDPVDTLQWILSTAGALSAIRSYLQNRRVLFQSSKLIALRSVDRRIRRLSNCRELKGTGEHWSWGEFSLSSEVNRTEERTKENWRNREEAEFVRCVLQIGPGYLFRTDPCCRFAAVSVLSKLEWMRENERECTSYVLSWWEREREENTRKRTLESSGVIPSYEEIASEQIQGWICNIEGGKYWSTDINRAVRMSVYLEFDRSSPEHREIERDF